MKFEEFKYERPDFDLNKKKLMKQIDCMAEAVSCSEFVMAFDELNKIRSHIATMQTLASIRHSINTSDPFYDDENSYWDECSPYYQDITSKMYEVLVNTKWKSELLEYLPEVIFMIAENELKAFDVRIIPLLQEENKLISKQAKLYASCEIPFQGEVYNLSSIGVLLVDKDRKIRKEAALAKMKWFSENESEIDDLFEQLVKLRTKIAQELGLDSFTKLGYLRMNRLDYDEKMVDVYRNEVLRYIVPISSELFEMQRHRMDLDKLAFYDLNNKFLTGNPTPKGGKDELVQAALGMYKEMSIETGEFFIEMIDKECFDLESKPNKQGGGYCADLADFKMPFIFSNFNQTSGDVDVLTHEAGHAFQSFLSMKSITIPECMFPTMESAEIHSMSMEFFAYPWMEKFFKEDTQKYYYNHLSSAITFIPYGVLVDHFQHLVYANPNCSKEDRKKMWRDLEKQYLPHKDYEDCELLEKGCWWYQQQHIFQSPFYYIDYALAQVCALQFWKRITDEDKTAWDDYVSICKIGGTKSFLGILKEAHLQSPFTEGVLEPIIKTVSKTLSQFDSSKF